MNRIITLTTDFGCEDHYVGTMKGVILGINRQAVISDITHNLPKYDILKAAFMLPNFINYYPKDSIHVVVVDPGVGTERKPIILETEKGTFVGPDNGVFSLVFGICENCRVYEISNEEYMLENVSNTFHGRDIFSPAAAHLSLGVDIKEFGQPIDSPHMLDIPVPMVKDGNIMGEVVYIDSFGNLLTNIAANMALNLKEIQVGGHVIDTVAKSYQDVQKGELLAIIGSSGFLEISVNQGRAAELINDKRVIVKK